MSVPRSIPEATVARLPLYLRCLLETAEGGLNTVSSDLLAQRSGVSAAQLRKDLSHLGSYGTRGVGYEVELLTQQIRRELGLDQDRNVAIVGVGNLGQALGNYRGFGARGFNVVAAFDSDSDKIGMKVGEVVVDHMSVLSDVISRSSVTMALIATPPNVAQDVCDRLVDAGVTSILNFAPVVLVVPAGVSLRKVDLGIELQILGYYQHQRRSLRDSN